MKRISILAAVGLLFSCTAMYAQKDQTVQQKAAALIKQDSRVADYAMNAKTGTVASLRFDGGNAYSVSETSRLLQTYFAGRKGVDEYRISNETTLRGNVRIVRYQQYFKGVKVQFGQIVAISRNGLLSYLTAENYVPDESKSTMPSVNETVALNKALFQTGASRYAWQDKTIKAEEGGAYPKGELVLMPDLREGKKGMVLAWKFDVYAIAPLGRDDVYVSAEDGSLIFKDARIKHTNTPGAAATRYSGTKPITTNGNGSAYELKESSTFMDGIETYNMNRGTNYNAAVIPTDNDNNWTAAEYNNANKDNALLDAHWGAEQVVGYWKAVHNRNSYDNNGTKLKSYVHYSNGYDNAFWNGSVMTYGDGSGGQGGFSPLTALDVCAHEIGHGVCQATSGLVYANESGAMNEGFSDIWGACVENYVDPANAVYEAFLIGEQITSGWIKGQNRNAMRDMANPPAHNNPDTYGGANWGYNEVHNRSGVLNKWFYLITHGESGTNDLGNVYTVTGLGFAKSEQIAFLTEISLTPNSTYADARNAAINATFLLYNSCGQETINVTNAWYAVGVGAAFNTATACDPKISFLSASNTVFETNPSTNCHPGRTVTGTLLISAPPTQSATVTLNAFGTAKLNRDYTLSPTTYTFTPGGARRFDFTITVYDNHIVEGDRSLVLTYALTGGGASAGNSNQTYTLKIRDDDVTPLISSQTSQPVTLLNEPMNGTFMPNGWMTGSFIGPAGNNAWTFGSAANLTGTNSAYVTNNTVTKPWTYTTSNSISDVYLLSPSLNAVNVSGMTFSFKYACNGENTDGVVYDYGSIVYSFDDGNTFIDYPNIQFYNTPSATDFSLPLPDSIFAHKNFRIGFRWQNDVFAGTSPPLAVDNITLTGTQNLTNVETTAGHNRTDYIPVSDPVFFYSSQDGQLIARLLNCNEQAGCVNATVSQAGTGQGTINSDFRQFKRTQKAFSFTPDAPNTTARYRLTLYFTPEELAVWGNKKLDLSFAVVRSGVNLSGNLSSNDIKIVTPVISSQGNGYISYTGDFTGFSQIMLVDPAFVLNCTGATRLYVDSSRAESGDGLSWPTAFTSLTEALQVANACSAVQRIDVAKGTYFPTTGTARDASFTILRNNLRLYGGYPPGGGNRTLSSNPTVLSGNIGNLSTPADNSYHVMMVVATPAANIDTTVRIDGFTVTGGYADLFQYFAIQGYGMYHDNGGGIYCYGQEAGNNCKPLIANCTFYGNRANNRGGAIFNEGYNNGNSSPTILNCVFYNNVAGYNYGSSGDNGGGGAVYNNGFQGLSSPSVINCSFYGNNANVSVGGAVCNYGNSSPAITNSIIYLNNNNTGNSNVANLNGANSFNISYSIVQGGPAGSGNVNANPLFINPGAGDLRLQQCSPAVNAGNAGELPPGTATDVAGAARIFNATVDMGAYECTLLPTTFTFKGAGNWSIVTNWQCNWTPPSPLAPGSEIVIDPVGGDCILNRPYAFGAGGKMTIKTGKKLIVQP